MENEIINKACDLWGVNREDLFSDRKIMPFPFVRAMIAYELTTKLGYSKVKIGEVLSRKHLTIIYALKMYEHEYQYNNEFRVKADILANSIKVETLGDKVKKVYSKLTRVC